ncbi:MAG: type II toxin-antitoxin system VapC family toxin [Candidatus Sumerlaeia bacterium]
MESRRVLADTSLFIEHLRAPDKTQTHLYRLALKSEVETCSIVAAEIYYGARKIESEKQASAVLAPFIVHPFTAAMAERMSRIVRELRKKNQMQDIRDVMIAAAALELNVSLATINRAHFERMPGLRLIKTL